MNLLDEDGYPTEETLTAIELWPFNDTKGLWRLVQDTWWMPDWGFGPVIKGSNGEALLGISTGGWSGNEDIIVALRDNHIFWMFYWESSHRGGHYEFRVKEDEIDVTV